MRRLSLSTVCAVGAVGAGLPAKDAPDALIAGKPAPTEPAPTVLRDLP